MIGDALKRVMAAELSGARASEADKDAAVVDAVELVVGLARSLDRIADAVEKLAVYQRNALDA